MSKQRSLKRALIEEALPRLHFEKIAILLYPEEHKQTHDCEEVVEFAPERCLLISESRLAGTWVAGNRVANTAEVWLYPDGTLHEYEKSATWASIAAGCTQRRYIGPVGEEKISLADLKEQIAFNLASDYEDPWDGY